MSEAKMCAKGKGEGHQCRMEIALKGQKKLAAQCINDEGKLIYIIIMKVHRSQREGGMQRLSLKKCRLWEYFSNLKKDNAQQVSHCTHRSCQAINRESFCWSSKKIIIMWPLYSQLNEKVP